MLSVLIATHDSERALVPTLAALVSGAVAGVVREVIIADAGSADATAEIADGAGCRVLILREPRGARLKAAGRGVGKHQRVAGDFGAGANNRAVNRETPGAAQVARGT